MTAAANLSFLPNSSGTFVITAFTASVSTTTGALVVTGGVGVGGNIYTGGQLHMTSGTSSVFYIQYNTTASAVDFIFG